MTLDHVIFLRIIYGTTLPQWVLGTTLVCLCQTWMTMILWRKYEPQLQLSAHTNHFSIADLVTLGRGFLVAGVAGFLFLPKPGGLYAWFPGSLYLIAVLADYADGYLARLHNSVSEFGAALDRNFDALTTLIGSLLGILYTRIPSWYLAVGLSFYVFSLSIWIMKASGRKVLELPASNYRRVVGGSNAVFVGVALTPAVPVTWLALLSALFTALVLSGFVRDWFSISGIVKGLPPAKGINSKLYSKRNLQP
jgi:phosphatidylglycerophosphate synthase